MKDTNNPGIRYHNIHYHYKAGGIYELTGFRYIDSIGILGLAYLSFNKGKECFIRIKNNFNCTCAKV